MGGSQKAKIAGVPIDAKSPGRTAAEEERREVSMKQKNRREGVNGAHSWPRMQG